MCSLRQSVVLLTAHFVSWCVMECLAIAAHADPPKVSDTVERKHSTDGANPSKAGSRESLKQAPPLMNDRIYFYKSSSKHFQDRLNTICMTLPSEYLKNRESDVLVGARQVADSYDKLGWWKLAVSPVGGPIPDIMAVAKWIVIPQIETTEANQRERHNRALPKTKDCKQWSICDFEDIEGDIPQSVKPMVAQLSNWNLSLTKKTLAAQPSVTLIDSIASFVRRSSDGNIVFIGGVHWKHALKSDGYTEYHLVISGKTGEIITERLAYTNAVFEPNEFEQYRDIALTATEIAQIFITLSGK